VTVLAIGYVRVSSEAQAGEKQSSLRDQRDALASLADRLGYTLGTVFEDAGLSGATVRKRPALLALIRYCEANKQPKGEPAFVLVLNDSRFGRFDDPDEAAALRFRLKSSGWVVRFAEADDIADPSIRHIMRAVGGAQASEYRRNLRANTTRGRIGTTKQGFWASRDPFGYRRAVVYPVGQARTLERGQPKARGEKIKLVPHEAEAEIVREIFRRYASGAYSMRALCRWLNTEPVATIGRQAWAGPTVHGLLENETYLGRIAARRRTAERMERGVYGRGPAEYRVEGTHAALVDQETFDRVQAQLVAIPARGDVFDYRVRGLVTCGTCGEPFMGGGLGSKLATGKRVHFYICAGGREKRCPPRATTISSTLLERTVIEQVAEHVKAQTSAAAIRAAFGARLANRAAAPKPIAHLTRAKLEARRDRLVAAVEAGTITNDEAGPRIAAIRRDLENVSVAPAVAIDDAARRAHVERLAARGRDFVALAGIATGNELRTLLRPWVDSMTFEKGTRELTLTLRTLAAGLLPETLREQNSPEQTVTRRALVSRKVSA
jgi:DNA invertase Pin-like site-specific DNA recombinase